MNNPPVKLKNYRLTLIVLTITYCAFVLLFEKQYAHKGEERIKEHALIVADDLWNFNPLGIAEYLSLAAESDHYERLTVVNHSGEVYQQVETKILSPALSWAVRLGVIPRVELISPIEHEQKYIGWIEGIWIPQTLFTHFTVFCFHAVIFLVILLNQRTKNENLLLEKRVEERTNELSLSNKQLKNEIDERKAAEQALKRYKHIISSTDDLMSFVNSEYLYLAVNEAYLKAYNKPMEEIVGCSVMELVGDELFHKIVKEYIDKALKGEKVQFQQWFIYPGLGRRYMDVKYHPFKTEHGKITGIVVTVHDLTSRHRAEEALRDSEEKFRALVENINDVIYSIDERGRISYISPPFTSWTGYDRDEVISRELVEFLADDDSGKLKKWQEGKYEDLVQVHEFRLITKSGDTLWVRSSSRPKKENGKIIGLRGTLTDITENKKLEAQLLQSQKMEAVGTLAGGVAHDFNNLLTGIQGYVSLLQLECSGKNSALQYLENVESYVKSGAGLTKQLLGFARGGKYEVKATNLNALIQKSSEIFARTRKSINIVRELASELWVADVDERQIEQVLINLYLNAWQAMPDGGNLIIRSENFLHRDDGKAEVSVVPGEYIKITVEDNGIGMDAETMQRIFDPFFTTKELGRGTGLGLASSYGIIRNHNGEISVSSRKGSGTVVSVFLPASHSIVEDVAPGTAGVMTGKENLLVIDDEQMVLDVGQALLQSLGYGVRTASSGKEAIKILEQRENFPDLVILDLIMPNMGGSEVYDRIKDMSPDIKVLLSSGYSIDGEAQAVLGKGCDGFIQKPFSLLELSQKVRAILDN